MSIKRHTPTLEVTFGAVLANSFPHALIPTEEAQFKR